MKREELIKTVQDAVEEAYKAGYAEGIKDGNINDGTFAEKVNEAYKRGYTKGKEDGVEELEVKVSTYEAKVYTYEKIIANSNFAPMFQFQFRTKPVESKPTTADVLNMLRGMIEGKTPNDFVQVQAIENLIERIEEEQRPF